MSVVLEVQTCSRCERESIVHQPYSGLHLCGIHLVESVRKRVSKSLRKQLILPKNSIKSLGRPFRVLIAISGGKDSAILLHFLHDIVGSRRDVELIAGVVDEGIEGYRSPSVDCAQDLCNRLNIPLERISYPDLSFPEMDEVANGRKKILLKWSGNPEFEHDQFRTFPVDPLWDLSKYGQLFSVQFENDGDMTKNAPIWDLKHLMDSWQDTYDIIANSDLLITSCTAVAHMAGGMGKKVIVIVPMVPYMIWPDHGNADEYWYEDNVTIIRQKEYGTWKHAMDELYEVVPKILES